MKYKNFTEAFIAWVRSNEAKLNAEHITVRLPETVAKNGTYADFLAASGEATVEVWDYGFSEFHVLDPETEQASVTHHEFQEEAEMYAALDQLVNRMSEGINPPALVGSWPLSGYSKIEYVDPSLGDSSLVDAAKGKSK